MGGADSKVTFKEKLNQFVHGKVEIDDNVYWNSLLRAPLQMELIHESLTVNDIRELRQQRNTNIEHFFARVLNELNSIIDQGAYNPGGLSKETQQTVLTCIRLLTRIIPVLLEIQPSQPSSNNSNNNNNDNIELNGEHSGGIRSSISELATTPSVESLPKGSQINSANEQFINHSANQLQSEAEFIYKLFWQSQFRLVSPSGSNEELTAKSEDSILAVQILTALQRLLFVKGFTVSAPGVVIGKDEIPPKHKVDTRFLWKGGVGAFQEINSSTTPDMTKARTEVLRCLLGCLSSTLYTSVDEYQSGSPPLWLWVFTRGYLPYTANLYCSLMSTVFSYDPNSYGLGLFTSGVEDEELVTIALQVLCILVDFSFTIQQQSSPLSSQQQPENQQSLSMYGQQILHQASSASGRPSTHDTDSSKRNSNTNSVNVVRNAYRLMLAGMKRDSEIDLVFNGIIRLLSTISKSKLTYLGSGKSFGGYQELLILFWHLLTINPQFTRRIASRVNAIQVLQPLLVLLLENSTSRRLEVEAARAAMTGSSKVSPSVSKTDTPKTTDTEHQHNQRFPVVQIDGADTPSSSNADQQRIGLLHLCSFILLVLSSEREFAVALNSEYRGKFPLSLPAFRGCHADLLVLVTHRVVLDSLGALANDSLIDMLLTVLCNISAYVKTFCLESCVKLLNLLNRFSKPSWLFRASYHYHNVFFLLDVLNNAVQYQYEGNLCLVYSILRRKDLFIDLQNLTFPKTTPHRSSAQTNEVTTVGPNRDERHSSLSVESEELMIDGAESSSPTVWQPTEKWFTDWKSRIPLHTLLRLISCLLPMVETECQEQGLINQNEVLEYLKRTTMVGLLPVPHAIIIRNYHPNAYTGLWFTTYTWSVIVSRTHKLRLFDSKSILFLSVATTNEQ